MQGPIKVILTKLLRNWALEVQSWYWILPALPCSPVDLTVCFNKLSEQEVVSYTVVRWHASCEQALTIYINVIHEYEGKIKNKLETRNYDVII